MADMYFNDREKVITIWECIKKGRTHNSTAFWNCPMKEYTRPVLSSARE